MFHAHRLSITHLALEDEPAQRRLDFFLDRPLQRPGPVSGVVADMHQECLGCIGQFQGDVPFSEPLPDSSQLDSDDIFQVFLA